MATEEEIFEYILKTEGEEKVKDLAAAASLAEQKFQALYSTLGQGNPQTKAAASALIDVQQKLEQTKSAAGMSAQGFMNLGRTIDDLQYVPEQGLQPIINNIMEMSPQIGIALVAFQLLYTHADKLKDLFGLGSTKTEAERMDELAKATKRTADEERELQTLKERAKHVEAQSKPPDAITKRKDAIDKAIANGPMEDVAKDVDRLFGKQIRTMAELDPRTKKIDERIAHTKAGRGRDEFGDRLTDAETTQRLNDLQKERDAVYGEARARFMADLGKDNQAGNLKRLAEGASNTKLRDSLTEAAKTPEQIEQEKDQADSDREVQERSSRLAAYDEQRRIEDRDETERQEKLAEKQEEEHRSRIVQYQEDSRRGYEDRAVNQLAGGRMGRLAATGQLGEDDVRGALSRLGHSEEEVEKLLPNVLAQLREKGDETAKKRAGELGISVREARVQLLKDQNKPITDAFENHGDTIRGIYEKAQDAQRGRSQVVDSASLASSIQGGVGAKDPQLKMVEELQEANKNLLKILNKPENKALILAR